MFEARFEDFPRLGFKRFVRLSKEFPKDFLRISIIGRQRILEYFEIFKDFHDFLWILQDFVKILRFSKFIEFFGIFLKIF